VDGRPLKSQGSRCRCSAGMGGTEALERAAAASRRYQDLRAQRQDAQETRDLRIAEAVDAGESTHAVARATGLHQSTVVRILAKV
jgi:DNA invertase Pin-like site-specific DNA recombinase